jgi:lipopolysaccharide transport system permease protein
MADRSVAGWDWKIEPRTSWLGANLKEIFSYKDLLFRLVRKEFLATYQQTLLGPLWMLINPLLTVLTYDLIFDKVIGVSTEGFPSFLYFLAGIVLWNLFSDILNGTSGTFTDNAEVFSKVYFPRIIAPLSIMLLHCLRFVVQLFFLIVVVIYYQVTGQIEVTLSTWLISIPVIFATAFTALGCGLIVSIITAMYRDLSNLVWIVMRLLMFVCPIFYSQTIVPEKMRWLLNINPLSSLFELFRYAFLGKAFISVEQIVYSIIMMVLLVATGVLLYNKMGDKLMDVV